jgi:mono/diheme cytochrome c family protein
MRTIKWVGIVLSALVGCALLLVGILYVVGSTKVNRTYDVQIASLVVASDSFAVARGEHLANILGCMSCHGGDFSGGVMIDEPPFRVTASNLTTGDGGIGRTYSDDDFNRAIRHGVRPDGRSLLIMPSSMFHRVAPEDVAMIVAYIRSVEPVDNVPEPTHVRTMGRLLAAGMIDPAHEVRTTPARSTPAPPVGPSVEYGEYLAQITCAHCHGDDLRGGKHPAPDGPFSPDLAASAQWTIEAFTSALRTGVTPAGREMDPYFMPIGVTKLMTNDEITAVHAYLATLVTDV